MHRNAGDIGPRRKWSSLKRFAFIQLCFCIFANCEHQLVKHINGTLQYGVCSDACPKPSPTILTLNALIKGFQIKHVIDDYRIQYSYANRSFSWELDTVRMNCRKTDGIFNCTLPSNDCAYAIYGNVHAVGVCRPRACITERVNAQPDRPVLGSTRDGLTTMIMTLKGTHEDRIPYFSVQCRAHCLNDSVQIVALVYRCNRPGTFLDI